MPDSADRSRVLICVGGGVLVAGLALTAIVLRSPGLAHAPTRDRDFRLGRYQLPSITIHTFTVTAPADQGPSAVSSAIAGFGGFVAVVILLVILVAIGVGLAAWWRRRPRRQRIATASADPVPTVRAGVAEAQQRLRFGAPDDAIVECWAALEQAAARSGVVPDPAHTPSEFVIRLLDSLDADSEALQQLSQLYHRARFSSEPMTDADRELARESLSRIADSVAVRVRVP